MKADPAVQLRLLDLQALDARLDRLSHRRRTLPELAEVEQLTTRSATVSDDVVALDTEVSDISREQTKLENEVELVRNRAERDQRQLDSGSVTSARELENLQAEIASLGRRQSSLEDQLLEVMERREEAETRRDRYQRERDQLGADLTATGERRDASYVEIDAEHERASAERAAVVGELPPDLLARYEKIRASADGVGAATLRQGRCEGCHLTLNAADLSRIRSAAPDEVLRCEECGRILVRTPESGL